MLGKVCLSTSDFSIPKQLIANFDETGLELAPNGDCSFVKVGETHVNSIGIQFFFV
jgi:hypothetical protein